MEGQSNEANDRTSWTSWSCCEAEMGYYKEHAQNDLDR